MAGPQTEAQSTDDYPNTADNTHVELERKLHIMIMASDAEALTEIGFGPDAKVESTDRLAAVRARYRESAGV